MGDEEIKLPDKLVKAIALAIANTVDNRLEGIKLDIIKEVRGIPANPTTGVEGEEVSEERKSINKMLMGLGVKEEELDTYYNKYYADDTLDIGGEE